MDGRSVTHFLYDRDRMVGDPVSVFEAIRADGDVVWSVSLRRWIVVSRTAALAVLREPRLRADSCETMFEVLRTRRGEDLSDSLQLNRWLPFLLEDSAHVRVRSLFARVLADIRDEYLSAYEAASRALLDGLIANGGGDIGQDYAARLHAEALGRLADFPETDRRWLSATCLLQGSVDFSPTLPEMRETETRARAVRIRLTELAARPGAQPLMRRILGYMTSSGIAPDPGQAVEFLRALLFLGGDTLSGTITVGLAELLARPGGTRPAAHWPVIEELVEEVMRLSSSVQLTTRVASETLQLAGQSIAAGEKVLVLLPAANRDPSAFECPHDMKSARNAHVAFGAGRHLCVGMHIARAAVGIVFRHLSALPALEPAAGRVASAGWSVRTFLHFPVTINGTP